MIKTPIGLGPLRQQFHKRNDILIVDGRAVLADVAAAGFVCRLLREGIVKLTAQGRDEAKPLVSRQLLLPSPTHHEPDLAGCDGRVVISDGGCKLNVLYTAQ